MPKSKGRKKAKGKTRKKQGLSKSRAELSSLPSRKSMEGTMSNFFGGGEPSQPSALDEAQQIMYDAWETTTRRQRVALAKKALKLSRDCADAYVLLAEETAKSPDEAIDLYQKGVEAGERALGKKAFEEHAGYFWGLMETRPYMRARAGLAQSLWDAGNGDQAVDNYMDMLWLNPSDNQGIRDLLMPCLIELGRDGEAEKLFKRYKEDGMAVWMYSRTLLDFRKTGDSLAAGRSLNAALGENQHVPAYLLGRKKMPRHLPDYYGFGDENEAVMYVYGNKSAWEASPGALEWLAAKVMGGEEVGRVGKLFEIVEGKALPQTTSHGDSGWPGRKTDREKEALTTMPSGTKHKWTFRARFRRHAFGWRSQPAIKRIKEAVSEIKKAARKALVLGGGTAVACGGLWLRDHRLGRSGSI